MKVFALIVSLTSFMALTSAQRGHYAGSRPISDGIKGPFPEAPQQTQQSVGNRFTDNAIGNGAAQPVNQNANLIPNPIANPNLIPQYNPYNNLNLFNHFNQRPQQHQPFWFLNNQAINGHLHGQPQADVQPLANRGSFMSSGRRR